MSEMLSRPADTEYASYYGGYVNCVEGDDVLAVLRRQLVDSIALYGGISEEKANTAYEPGKWTIKQLLSHIIDGERVFAYRALRFSRGDATPIEGFDQDPYVENARLDNVRFDLLVDEFEHLRASTVLMLERLDEAGWLCRGEASGNEVSVRALAFIIAGHEIHHTRILRERYLGEGSQAVNA